MENPALDPIRYKTQMCKNWVDHGKCPYGPRCLFAHGRKDLRTPDDNSELIEMVASMTSPARQFYRVGRFPSFMPVPFYLDGEGKEEGSDSEEQPGC